MTFCDYSIEYYCARCERKMPHAMARGARISGVGKYTTQKGCPYCGNPVRTGPGKYSEHVRQGWRKQK